MNSVSLRLPPEVIDRLSFLATETGRTKSFYMAEAIIKHLEDLEDIYTAEQRLADIRAGRSKVISAEEMEREIDMAD